MVATDDPSHKSRFSKLPRFRRNWFSKISCVTKKFTGKKKKKSKASTRRVRPTTPAGDPRRPQAVSPSPGRGYRLAPPPRPGPQSYAGIPRRGWPPSPSPKAGTRRVGWCDPQSGSVSLSHLNSRRLFRPARVAGNHQLLLAQASPLRLPAYWLAGQQRPPKTASDWSISVRQWASQSERKGTL